MNSIQQETRVEPHPDQQPFLTESSWRKALNPVELAILKTSAYADIFDYPLDPQEMHFYLIEMEAPPESVATTLKYSRAIREYIEGSEGFFTLKGRVATIETRRSRHKTAARLMPKAFHYGSWIARFPFVRMVALTGALAVGNTASGADIDFLIVTEQGYVWTCRALLLPLVRLAALRGDRICPNYYLSEGAMTFSVQDLYTAHEVAQMIPIAGMETYWRLRALNAWTLDFLPNAARPYRDCAVEYNRRLEIGRLGTTGDWGVTSASVFHGPVRAAGNFHQGITGNGQLERILRLPLLGGFERWEMERKIRKFHRKYSPSCGMAQDEAAFSADWCKGHFDGHRQRTLGAYRERIRRLIHE